MKSVRLACNAMGTRFELVLYGDDARILRAAGEEAISEIKRLHDLLSIFRKQSLVSRINRGAGTGEVRVTAEVFHLLKRIQRLHEISDGSFDVTVGPLMEAWGFRSEGSVSIDRSRITEAAARVGFDKVKLDKHNRTVAFNVDGIGIDLGAVGKGYALDVAAEVIQAAGVEIGLLHGGTSTVRAVGRDPSGNRWRVAVKRPFSGDNNDLIGTISLEDEAMSVSAQSGRRITIDGGEYGHVLDPRSGAPVSGAELAVVVLPIALDADALSTGLLVLGRPGLAHLNRHVVGFRAGILENGQLHQENSPLETE